MDNYNPLDLLLFNGHYSLILNNSLVAIMVLMITCVTYTEFIYEML